MQFYRGIGAYSYTNYVSRSTLVGDVRLLIGNSVHNDVMSSVRTQKVERWPTFKNVRDSSMYVRACLVELILLVRTISF